MIVSHEGGVTVTEPAFSEALFVGEAVNIASPSARKASSHYSVH